MDDVSFKLQLNAPPMGRSALRRWKREYSKKPRTETPGEFYARVASAVRKTPPRASSPQSGRSGVR